VFSAKDLDELVEREAIQQGTSIVHFIDCLFPQTKLARFSAHKDASKWLVVENLGYKVRYEMSLGKDSRAETREFQSSHDATAFFFDVIRQGTKVKQLSLISCPKDLTSQIELLIRIDKLKGSESEKRNLLPP
jgi:hypothetical protein